MTENPFTESMDSPPAQFTNHVPGSAHKKATWITPALADNIILVIKTMTVDESDYANQYKLIQAHALFKHKKFVLLNIAAKEAFANLSTSNGPREFADALSNVASTMAGGSHSPYPLMKQQHQTALHLLLCLQKDKSGKYSIPKNLNSITETILKTGMKATGPMALNRALAHFTTNSRMLRNQHVAPFTIEQK
jgi:hypothetical protein